MRDRDAALVIAQGIAPGLPGWSVVPPKTSDAEFDYEDWVELVRGDGATIRVTVGGFRLDGRVSFRGGMPRYADFHYCVNKWKPLQRRTSWDHVLRTVCGEHDVMTLDDDKTPEWEFCTEAELLNETAWSRITQDDWL